MSFQKKSTDGVSFPNGKTTRLFESLGVSFLCSSISTISTTVVDELNVLLSRGLVELFRSRFGMSEIETKKETKKQRCQKLPLIEGAGKA